MQELADLARRELACLGIVQQTCGSVDDLNDSLESTGVFEEYRRIHVAYVGLLAADTTQEALKRAVFIQWYSLATPPFCSGIGVLDTTAEMHGFTRLDELLQTGQADAELTCMLQYYAYWDYAFDRAEFQHLTALQAFIRLAATADAQVSAPPLRIHDMHWRGGMGDYWLGWGGGKLQRKAV